VVPYEIRLIGDPILKERSAPVSNIDGKLHKLTEDMLTTMYEVPGLGLAAPQIGVQRRLFVYDVGDGPHVLVNPELIESSGEWEFEEGCLSVPGLTFDIVRPKEVHVRGLDLDGNVVDIEADELEARLFQHELDHLEGILLIEHLDEEQSKEAKRALRELALGQLRPVNGGPDPIERGLRLR
jgi:peptide deformylase